MDAAVKSDKESVIAETEENQKNVREMVMENDSFYGESNTKVLKESIEQMERHPERNVVKTLEELEQIQ